MNQYVPLFVHSSYSLLKSIISIKSLVKKCKELDLNAVALTDYHNMFGAMEFSMECKKQGIKGIIGCRARIEGNRELLLYCKNQVGYENLSYLITNSYLQTNKNLQPEIRWEMLQKKSEGLIAIAVPSIFCAPRLDDIDICASYLGPLEWYVGLESNKFQNESAYMSGKYKKSVVAVSETYFLNSDDQEAHDVILCIQSKKYYNESDRPTSDEYFKLQTAEEMYTNFAGLEFAIENTIDIANACDFMLQTTSPRLPKFKGNKNEEEMLVDLSREGLEERIAQYNIKGVQTYKDRLEFELGVINKMGFAGYFLIVSDFIKYAKTHDIPVGPGRGSGSGSIIAWCIKITEVDPIKFELFFERFLNPGRISLPDFDIDFSPRGRQAVINYVQQKYGSQCVAGIITFGSMSSRMVLKDVGRVFQISYTKVDNLSKKVQILFGRPFSLEEMWDRDPSFAADIENDESLRKVYEVAKKLEGNFRHASAHAAGIIITNTPLYRVSPLFKDQHSELPLVQFSMKYAEAAGLVKFDFLGLTALDIIYDVIKELKAVGIHIGDPYQLPLDDPKVFEFLNLGHTKGLFQLETVGITKLIMDMKADCIEDLIAIISLYRPGPMDNIPLFIKCKFGEDKLQYPYPQVDKILENTYGIMVYQEQILRIAQEIAGFSLGEADLLRRAMGKKIPEEMAMYKSKFIESAQKINGGSASIAEDLFNQIERFANYGFNKAHAAAYAIIGYIQAYLKTYYTVAYVTACLTLEQHSPDKLLELIIDAKGMNIKILPPCINTSENRFIAQNNTILYSLAAIKNIGEHTGNIIMNERKKRPFTSVNDLISRVNLNKREIEAFVKSGALDTFGINRGTMLQIAQMPDQDELLFGIENFLSDASDWSKEEAAFYQKEILGTYIDYHPLEQWPARNFGLQWYSKSDLKSKNIETFAILENLVRKMDRRNRPYLICSMSDPEGVWECIASDEHVVSFLAKNKNKSLWCALRYNNGRAILTNASKIEDIINSVQVVHVKTRDLSNLLLKFKDDKAQTSLYLHYDNASEFVGHIKNIIKFIPELTSQKLQWSAPLPKHSEV